MPAAAASIDHFERALAAATIGGAGLSVRLRLAQLKAEFEARGIDADDPRIPLYIAAILPQSPRVIGDAATLRDEIAVPPPSLPTGPVGVVAGVRQFGWRRVLKMASPLLCLLLAPRIVMLPRPNPDAGCVGIDCPGPVPGEGRWVLQPDRIITETNWLFFYALMVILLLGLLSWLVLRMRVRHLQKDSDPDVEPTLNLSVRLGRAGLFAGAETEKLMRLLRLRKAVVSRRIDVRASVRATIAHGGSPMFRFGVNRVRPEYLILSEREMIGDHLPEVGRALHARMAAAQVDAWHYEFQGVPDSLRHDHLRNRQGFEPVETVKRRHPEARAFLSAESFDIAAGLRSDAAWVEALVGEDQPVLLNPRAKEHWHEPENEFARAGFASLYAGALDSRHYAGFLARAASGGKAVAYEAEEEHDLPAFLAEDRDLMLSPMPIAADEIEAITGNLAHWLDAQEMAWLRTIALFPLLHPGFTHFSGLILSDGKGMDAARYLKIARLPWLRAGFMPDWLRQALVQGMAADEFAEAKSIIQSFFAPEAGLARSADDVIAVHEKEKAKKRKDRFEKRLARSAIPALSDSLLINAFAASAPEDVSLDLPPQRRRRWYQHALVQAAALTAAGSLALLSLVEPSRQVSVARPPIWLPSNLVPAPAEDAAKTPPQDEGSGSTGGSWGEADEPEDNDVVPDPPPVPQPPSILRNIVVSIADDGDFAPLVRILSGISSLNGKPAYFGVPVVRPTRANRSSISCSSYDACLDAASLSQLLADQGIKVEIYNRAGGQAVQADDFLELYIADGDIRSEPAFCNPGPYLVFFEWDSFNLSPEAVNLLDVILSNTKSCEGAFIQLGGHTDRSNSDEYAMALSERMANSVKNFMVKSGIPASRISVMAYGETRPRVETADGVREVQNRRVEIFFAAPAAAN